VAEFDRLAHLAGKPPPKEKTKKNGDRPLVNTNLRSPRGKVVEADALKLIAPRLQLMIEAFNDEDGNELPPIAVYLALKKTGIRERWMRSTRYNEQKQSEDPLEILTPQQQYDAQVKDLYKRAIAGDIQAKKLWFELSPVLTTDQTFNISINIKDYRIKDASLKNIMAAAEQTFVHDALMGIMQRMELDEAPHELRALLKSFDNKFQHWAKTAYAARNA